MPLLALSMLFPKFGIEPNSHYAIGTLLTYAFNVLVGQTQIIGLEPIHRHIAATDCLANSSLTN